MIRRAGISCGLVLLLLSPLLLLPPADSLLAGEPPKTPKRASPLVAHEWGTFTTIADEAGGSLEWRPLAGTVDLPSFVYGLGNAESGHRFGQACASCSHYSCGCGPDCKPKPDGHCGRCKSCVRSTVRMETPVIYFYTQEEQEVSVKVGFPGGEITEWYPKALEVKQGIDWGRIRLVPDAKVTLPREKEDNHYYPARETDSVLVRTCGWGKPKYEYEKFLFYRGVGNFSLPLSVRHGSAGVQIDNRGEEPIHGLILFEREGTRSSYRMLRKALAPGQSVTLQPGSASGSLTQLKSELRAVLEDQGLYRKEAQSMINTWDDHWFVDGLRVFYLVPEGATNRILPLQIKPAPDELVRVLVGRVEILSPAKKQRIRALAEQLGSDSEALRRQALAGLVPFGRFAEPVLKTVVARVTDPAHRKRLEAVLSH